MKKMFAKTHHDVEARLPLLLLLETWLLLEASPAPALVMVMAVQVTELKMALVEGNGKAPFPGHGLGSYETAAAPVSASGRQALVETAVPCAAPAWAELA